jgi:hypothetical protein
MTWDGSDTYGVVKWKLMVEDDHHISTAPSSHFTMDHQDDLSQSEFDRNRPFQMMVPKWIVEIHKTNVFPGIERMNTN